MVVLVLVVVELMGKHYNAMFIHNMPHTQQTSKALLPHATLSNVKKRETIRIYEYSHFFHVEFSAVW